MQKKPTILCIMQLPPPVHGVTTMNSYLANSELLKNSFLLDIINLQFNSSYNKLKKFSIKKVIKAIAYGFEIVRKMRYKKPQLVYFTLVPTGFAFYRDAYYVFLLKFFKVNIVLHLHGKGIKENADNNFIKKRFYKWIFKDTFVICLSEKLTLDIADIYKQKPFIVANGIEVHPYFNRPEEASINAIPKILYLSNFTRNKGILTFIESLGLLKKEGHVFIARIVGAPYLTIDFLEKYIETNDLSGYVEIIGPLYGEDKLMEYKNADVFVFPTHYEAFGLVNLEAMQFSLPVVSTFEGSIPDIVLNNETGFLVEKQNSRMMADKIGILLTNEELRTSMGQKGYDRFINNYTLRHFEFNMAETLKNILQLKSKTVLTNKA